MFGKTRFAFFWVSDRLSHKRGKPVQFDAELANSAELFDAEGQLAAHHTLATIEPTGPSASFAALTLGSIVAGAVFSPQLILLTISNL